VQAAESIDEVVRALGNPSFVVTAVLARWHAPTAMLAWINCGHPPAYVVDGEGAFTELEGPVHARSAPATAAELRGRRGQPRAR
jgi:serine phosphatase RsbU (regulator of sigma subunit)